MDELVAHVRRLEDRLGEEPARTRRGQQVRDALASSRFAEDGHILWIASERRLPEENLFLVQALELVAVAVVVTGDRGAASEWLRLGLTIFSWIHSSAAI